MEGKSQSQQIQANVKDNADSGNQSTELRVESSTQTCILGIKPKASSPNTRDSKGSSKGESQSDGAIKPLMKQARTKRISKAEERGHTGSSKQEVDDTRSKGFYVTLFGRTVYPVDRLTYPPDYIYPYPRSQSPVEPAGDGATSRNYAQEYGNKEGETTKTDGRTRGNESAPEGKTSDIKEKDASRQNTVKSSQNDRVVHPVGKSSYASDYAAQYNQIDNETASSEVARQSIADDETGLIAVANPDAIADAEGENGNNNNVCNQNANQSAKTPTEDTKPVDNHKTCARGNDTIHDLHSTENIQTVRNPSSERTIIHNVKPKLAVNVVPQDSTDRLYNSSPDDTSSCNILMPSDPVDNKAPKQYFRRTPGVGNVLKTLDTVTHSDQSVYTYLSKAKPIKALENHVIVTTSHETCPHLVEDVTLGAKLSQDEAVSSTPTHKNKTFPVLEPTSSKDPRFDEEITLNDRNNLAIPVDRKEDNGARALRNYSEEAYTSSMKTHSASDKMEEKRNTGNATHHSVLNVSLLDIQGNKPQTIPQIEVYAPNGECVWQDSSLATRALTEENSFYTSAYVHCCPLTIALDDVAQTAHLIKYSCADEKVVPRSDGVEQSASEDSSTDEGEEVLGRLSSFESIYTTPKEAQPLQTSFPQEVASALAMPQYSDNKSSFSDERNHVIAAGKQAKPKPKIGCSESSRTFAEGSGKTTLERIKHAAKEETASDAQLFTSSSVTHSDYIVKPKSNQSYLACEFDPFPKETSSPVVDAPADQYSEIPVALPNPSETFTVGAMSTALSSDNTSSDHPDDLKPADNDTATRTRCGRVVKPVDRLIYSADHIKASSTRKFNTTAKTRTSSQSKTTTAKKDKVPCVNKLKKPLANTKLQDECNETDKTLGMLDEPNATMGTAKVSSPVVSKHQNSSFSANATEDARPKRERTCSSKKPPMSPKLPPSSDNCSAISEKAARSCKKDPAQYKN